jgi:hypothetical protein
MNYKLIKNITKSIKKIEQKKKKIKSKKFILRKIFRGKIKINTINTFVFLKVIKFFYKNKYKSIYCIKEKL